MMLDFVTDWIYHVVTFVVMLICVPIYYFENYCRFWTSKKIPSLKPYPIFGSFWGLLTLKTSPADFFKKIYSMTDNKLMGIFVFYKPGLLIRCPELIKLIFIKDFDKFSNRYTETNEKYDSIGSQNLLTIKQPKWEDLRDKLAPILSTKKIINLFPFVKEAGENLEHYLYNKLFDRGDEQKVFDVEEISMRFAADAVVSTIFDVQSNCLLEVDSKFTTAGERIMHHTIWRRLELTIIYFLPQLSRFLKLKFFDRFTSNLLRKTTLDVIRRRDKSETDRKDLISDFIKLKNAQENKNPFDDERIVSQTTSIFTSGLNNVTCIMTYALYELGLNPELQKRLRNEIEQKIYDKGEITYHTVTNMKYLDMVVSETLRKYPPIPFLSRECTSKTDYVLPPPFENISLKAGTPVFVSILGLHMDRKNFPDPNVFDPERFTEIAKKSRHPDCFLPFGIGPRACLGADLSLLIAKVGLIYFIRKYKINISAKTPPSLKTDPLSITLTPLGKVLMEIEKIEY